MGIKGWTRLLTEAGVLPESDNGDLSTSLWLDSSTNHHLADHYEPIPAHSTLHIDGNGLVFFLYRVAYARHVQAVLQSHHDATLADDAQFYGYHHSNGSSSNNTNLINVSLHQLAPEIHSQLIPTWMPLGLVHSVTKEWVTALSQQQQLLVYWDGPARPVYKARTEYQRRLQRAQEWSNVQAYCQHGHILADRDRKQQPSLARFSDWLGLFPMNRLVAAQVQQTLHEQLGVRRVDCPGEADDFMARQASTNGNSNDYHYILGQDSDFTVLRGISYIPFNTLTKPSSCLVASNVWWGLVIRRAELVARMDLPDEQALVEVALALGNDFLPRYQNQHPKRPQQLLEMVQSQGPGFRLSAVDETLDDDCSTLAELNQVMDFCRRWYNLQEIRSDELRVKGAVVDDDEDEAGDIIPHQHRPNQAEPPLPIGVDLSPARRGVTFGDGSIKDSVVRCLQSYLDTPMTADHETTLTQQHIDLFSQMSILEPGMVNSTRNVNIEDMTLNWRPTWQDATVCFWMEKLMAMTMQSSRESPLVRLFPPLYNVFDAQTYLRLLARARLKPDHPDGVGVVPTDVTPTPADNSPAGNIETERPVLPIDEHEETIVLAIQKNRVTIIQGETGCGKSSRIPVMLLNAPPPDPSFSRVKMFVSQPRRIAAKALVERVRAVEPRFRDAIALRMGHGVREYEHKDTQAFFVTTGYLVRLLANHPEKFDSVSHLIIDEVHERSVDTDILCLLCRRLLVTNPRIRLVLMSATLAASMYQKYFRVSQPVIKVGARRFPVEEVFLEDLPHLFKLPTKENSRLHAIMDECTQMKCLRAPSASYMEKVCSLVSYLATVVGSPGSSVLVFVPGMNEIVVISELVENMFVSGVRFTCFPIHSDIPFDDQMQVFDSPASDEVKIIIATNAAESSITLPDVDHVICLGLCKQIVYNELSHRQMLVPTWISKASATQRAGRTGRLRPGTVYRMYTRENLHTCMDQFEPGEMLRIPLDSVILMLKEMLVGEAVTDVLLDCLEPPEVSTIGRSFESLFLSRFITTADDDCEITTLGKFVSALGIDLALGSVIGLGIQFGVGAEAIEMAAILSFPKSPWVISNALIHEPKDFNEQTSKTYVSRCHFDANLFSEPLAIMNLLWEFNLARDKNKWCWRYGVFLPRIRRLSSTRDNLRRRVGDFLGIPGEAIAATDPPVRMPHAKVTVLRIIQAWVFHDSVIECRPEKYSRGLANSTFTVELGQQSHRIEKEHLDQILSADRHPFDLKGYCEVQQKGSFDLVEGREFSFPSFEERLLSYCTDRDIGLAWVTTEECQALYVDLELAQSVECRKMISIAKEYLDNPVSFLMIPHTGKSHRGLYERACGNWMIRHSGNLPATSAKEKGWKLFRSTTINSKAKKRLKNEFDSYVRTSSGKGLSLSLPNTRPGSRKSSFVVVCHGFIKPISLLDLKDLFAAPALKMMPEKQTMGQQQVVFHLTENRPLTASGETENQETSWDRPLIGTNLPEGARILSALASDRRKGHFIRLRSSGDALDAEEHLDIHLDSKQTGVGFRWRRMNTDKVAFVQANSVPATAVPLKETGTLFCLCANTLEVRGGGVRVEGLTLLPPGRLFFLLCRLSYGLFKRENLENGILTELSVRWLSEESAEPADSRDWERRIDLAVSFHEDTCEMGETLECFPNKVQQLLALFDRVDGHTAGTWSNLFTDPFVRSNIRRYQANGRSSVQKSATDGARNRENDAAGARVAQVSENGTCSSADIDESDDSLHEAELILAATSHITMETSENSNPVKNKKEKARKNSKRTTFPAFAESIQQKSKFSTNSYNLARRLFATEAPGHGELKESDMPSSNILAIVVETSRQARKGFSQPMTFDGEDWTIFELVYEGLTLYQALFNNKGFRYTKQKSDKKKGWLTQKPAKARPATLSDAVECIPPAFKSRVEGNMLVLSVDGTERIVFKTLELAVRMEAAFWLERQFCTTKLHWYQRQIEWMVQRLEAK